MAGVIEIGFLSSKSIDSRLSRLRRTCNVRDNDELVSLTGLSMYDIDSRVRHGGSIKIRGTEYRLIIRECPQPCQ